MSSADRAEVLPAGARRPARSAPGSDGGPDASSAPQGTRLLVVEDDYLVGMELEAGLADAGFDVLGVAATADEAVALTRRLKPELIVMDVRLAGARDGIDAAIEIYRSTGIRSLFATAYADPATRARAAASAPLGWISKPYTIEAIAAAIRTGFSAPS